MGRTKGVKIGKVKTTKGLNHGNPYFKETHPVSGYKGVTWNKKPQKWTSRVSIQHPTKGLIQIYLGVYNTPEEAYIARIKYLDGLK